MSMTSANLRATGCSKSSSNVERIVAYHDPHVPIIRPTREHPHWAGIKSVPWTRPTISGFDLVVIATAHASVNYQELADWAQCIVDTRNVMASVQVSRPARSGKHRPHPLR